MPDPGHIGLGFLSFAAEAAVKACAVASGIWDGTQNDGKVDFCAAVACQ